MFVQVIEGRVADAEGIKRLGERWHDEIRPSAKGYLGSTHGITEDGVAITIARFESEGAARANSDRPEQGDWWAEMAKNYEGEPTFTNYTNVQPFQGGGSDDAGFVQVIRGKTNNLDRYIQLGKEMESEMSGQRPDVIGGISAFGSDGDFTEVIYFTSEEEARKGEANTDFQADDRMKEWQELVTEIRYLDLKEPVLRSG